MIKFIYTGDQSQLIQKGFIVQDEIVDHCVTKNAIRDFKHLDEAVIITLATNDASLKETINLIRLFNDDSKNHKYLKHEIMDLIDEKLVLIRHD